MDRIKEKVVEILLESDLALTEDYGPRSRSYEDLDWRDAERIATRIMEECRPDVRNLESMVSRLLEINKEYKEALICQREEIYRQMDYRDIDDFATPVLSKYELSEWEIETELIANM